MSPTLSHPREAHKTAWKFQQETLTEGFPSKYILPHPGCITQIPSPVLRDRQRQTQLGLLCTATTTTNEATVTANAINDTSIIVPRLAGNLPFITQYCADRYRLYPRNRIKMLIPKNVAPRGLPIWRSLSACCPSSANDVLSRKSCVMAMPIDANANDVRSQAKKVLSARQSVSTASAGLSCAPESRT